MASQDTPEHRGPQVGVGELVAALRAEVLRRRTGAVADDEAAGGAPRARLEWEGLIYLLGQADGQARLGTALPEMTRFRGIKRPFARFAARCVLVLSRFLTAAQRQFNLTLLDALRQLGDRVQQLERAQNETARWLERALAERDARLHRLEADLARLRGDAAGPPRGDVPARKAS